jgi:hypothetical protein
MQRHVIILLSFFPTGLTEERREGFALLVSDTCKFTACHVSIFVCKKLANVGTSVEKFALIMKIFMYAL